LNTRTMIVTMIAGTMFFIGVGIIILPNPSELAYRISSVLIFGAWIPYLINWMFKPDNKIASESSEKKN